jgi:hypothetical protein
VEREDGPLARVLVPVPQGEGYILLRFEDTPLHAAAKWVTIATVLLVVIAALVRAAFQHRLRIAKSTPR